MTVEEILTGEKSEIEYKEDIPAKSENYMRTVVAFANANGGRLVFGVENNTWNIRGFGKEEVFQKMDAITNAIYDSCEPKITPNIEIQEFHGKYIIVADVPAGMQRPYCIKSQGMIDGVYLRVSGTTRKAAIYQIQEMALYARNRSFDSEPIGRELSEMEMEGLCKRLYQHALNLCADEEMKKSLKQIGIRQLVSFKAVHEEKGKYYATNGYQLLDGELGEYPDAVVQCAVFKGKTRNIFITRKEFSGCIDEEVESAYNFVLEHINLGSRIEGLARQDIYELPIRSIREMITNAVCHRSYLCPGKVQVALFDDRLEITSPGMLDKDLTVEKMKLGISKIRNSAIAKIFAYMNMVEAWGTGIPKIFEEAKEYGLREPELLDLGSDFRINLFRREMEVDLYGVIGPQASAKAEIIGETGKRIGTNGTKVDSFSRKDGTKKAIVNGKDGTKKANINVVDGTKRASINGKDGTKKAIGNGTKEGFANVRADGMEREPNMVLRKLLADEEKLVSFIREDGAITQKQMSQRTGLSLRTVKRMTVELQRIGKIVRVGSSRSGKWKVIG